MANTLYIMDAAALFLGDADPTEAEIITIKSVKIPALKEKTKSHMGGGATMEVNLGMRALEPLEFSFKLEGINEKAMGQLMPVSGRLKYTVRGNIRDIKSGADIGIRAIIDGRMTSYEPGEFSRDQGMESDYMFAEIMGYQLFVNDVEKFYFDYFGGSLGVRVNGDQIFRAQARNLGLV